MAARLYASGAVPTKRAACQAVGLHPAYLTVLDSNGNEVTTRIQSEVETAIADKTIALSQVVAIMSRRALQRVNGLIDSNNEHVALKASSDILDRNPETSKTMKHSVSGLILDGQDAKELAEALVIGARVKEQYRALAQGDFIKVEVEDGKASVSSKSDPSGDQRQSEEAQDSVTLRRATDQGEAVEGTQEGTVVLTPEITILEGL